ncbi:MAG: phosphoglycerate kinase [Patescibacteria group bacterium]
MKVKTIKQVKNLAGKKVLLRVDFNVPIKNGKIQDDYKIIASLPTIRYLLRYKAKIIIISHLSSPKAKGSKYSLKPVSRRLHKILNHKVKFLNDCLGFKVSTEVTKMKPGEIIFLENLRFYNEEIENNTNFAKQLASLADVYINDSFGVDHRKQASLVAIKKYLPSYAGFLVETEVNNLNKIIAPKEPLLIILGGKKASTKLPIIKNLQRKADKILIGGALANNFLKLNKIEIGKSIYEPASLRYLRKLNKNKIILPLDVIVNTKKDGTGKVYLRKIKDVKKNEMILDIGPATQKLYADLIKKAKTIIWNGPMGCFEKKHYQHGSLAIARLVGARSSGKVFGVVGGGETIEVLKMAKMLNYIDWVSTGGGAMLTYLSGQEMPGLAGIIRR